MILLSAIFICPTYYLTRAFNGTSFKVGTLRLSHREHRIDYTCGSQGELAIPPGNHGDDLAYYYPTTYADFSLLFNASNLTIAWPVTTQTEFHPMPTRNSTPLWRNLI